MSIITISRGSLSATESLAKKVSEKLSWPVISREDVLSAADKYGIKESGLVQVSFLDESPHLLDKLSSRKKLYLTCFQTALFEFALNGSMIYHGHLGQFLLTRIPYVLRIMLTAPLEYRINALVKERGMSREQAKSYIKSIDEHRMKWSSFLYGVNWKDPIYYDLVLNIERMSLDLASDIIVESVSRKEFQPTAESTRLLKNLHLASLSKVYLQQSPRTRGSDVEIEADADAGKLLVRGSCPTVGAKMWEDDIRNVLQKIEGVKVIEIKKELISYHE
ncbi:MAG: AAA family ATPase [Candidatus Kryptoniota bacterium]